MREYHHAVRHILCPRCDLLVALPPLEHGYKAACPRCDATLITQWRAPGQRSVAYALAALLMLLPSGLFPLITVTVAGVSSEVTLLDIPRLILSEDDLSPAIFFLLFVLLAPVGGLIIILLLASRTPMPRRVKVALACLLFHLKRWGMAEIFLAAVLVSLVKLMAYGTIGTGSSFIPWCLFCLLQLYAFQCVDRHWLWNNIAPAPYPDLPLRVGETGLRQGVRACPCCRAILPAVEPVCPRCHATGYLRRKHSLQWTMALLLTSLMLWLPANILPMMMTDLSGDKTPSTIIAGVILLWGEGSYPVAAVIFIASIMLPGLKMLSIGWLCWDASGHGKSGRRSTRLIYEIVEFVGRWSMIDIFVIAVLSALVRLGTLVNIYPAMGTPVFASVVIITMFAAITFDPRLSWDRVAASGHKEP